MRARPATVEQYGEFRRFFVELSPTDPPPPRDWWERFCGNALFIESDGTLVAYGHAYPLSGDLAYVLYVAVAPEARNRGVGRALMMALAAKLRGAGCAEWSLNVVATNAAAIALYRRLGMRHANSTDLLTMPWSAIESLPLVDVVVEDLRSEDDARIECELGMTAGRLTSARQMPGRVLKRTNGGVMVFDPTFPIATILRASTPGVARALLDAAREHCGPEHEHVRVNVEEPALLAVFRGAGAEVVKSLLHLRGALPTESGSSSTRMGA